MKNDLLAPSEAGRILERSPQAVVWYAEQGLLAHIKTARGNRLFRREDVEAFKAQLKPRLRRTTSQAAADG